MASLVTIGNLCVNLSADTSRLKTDMTAGAQTVEVCSQKMVKDIADVRSGFETVTPKINEAAASTNALAVVEQKRAAATSSGLQETARLWSVASSAADEAAASFAAVKIDPKQFSGADSAIKDLDGKIDRAAASWQEKVAFGIGAGVGAGAVAAKTYFEKFEDFVKSKLIIAGIAIAAGVTVAAVTAVYAAYKVASASIGFIEGLFTGESYKSENIDALIKLNNEVKTLQGNLQLTAVGASALNEALKLEGVDGTAYAATFNAASGAIRTNREELDRLGVAYKDQAGNLLPVEEVLKNAGAVLATYTDGWDRQQAATAIGMGSEKDIQAALSVSAEKIQAAKDRLVDYNLIVGEGSQEAVAQYEKAMRDFNRESEMTSLGFKRAIADQVMPILTQLAEFFREGFPYAVNAFRYSMATVTSLFYGLKTVVYMVSESILGSISAIGSGLAGVATAGMRVMSGDFSGAKDALLKGWTDAKSRLGLIGDNIVEQARRNAAAMRLAWGADSFGAGAQPNSKPKTGKTWTPKPEEEDEAATAATVSEYDRLIRAIKEKIATQELDLASTGDLTEGQKIAARFVADLRDNILDLTDAQKLEVTNALEALIALEKANAAKKEAAKIEKEVKQYLEQSAIARSEAAQQLQIEYALYGKSNDAREIAIVKIKAQADAEKEIAKLQKEGNVSQEQIDRIRAEAAARGELAQATLAQSKALNYANDLLVENRKFIAESIADEDARNKALLEIDAEMWRERIRLAGDGTEAQKVLQQQFDQWYANRQMAPVLERWKSVISNLGNDFREGFREMLSHGKDAWESFTKSIGNTLKTALADAVYQTFIKKYAVQIVASIAGVISGPSVAGALTGGSNPLTQGANLVNAGSNLYSAATSMSSMGNTAAQLYQYGSTALSGGTAAVSTGAAGTGWVSAEGGASYLSTGASSIGSAFSTAVPYLAAAYAIYSIAKSLDHSGTYHTGALAEYSASGGLLTGSNGTHAGPRAGDTNYGTGFGGVDFSQQTADFVGGISKSIVGILDSTASTFGKTAGYTAATAFADDTSKDGAWGALLISKLGEKIVDWQDTRNSSWAPREFGDGEAGRTQYLAELSRSVRTALDDIGLPGWAQSMLDGLGNAPALTDLAAVVDKINAVQHALVNMGDVITGFASLSDGATTALIAASGGADTFIAGMNAFYNDYTTEAEKVANLSSQVSDALAAVGLEMPTTREELRALFEAQLALGEAGAPAVAAILRVQGAFGTVADYTRRITDETLASARQAADEAARASQEAARIAQEVEQQRQQAIGEARSALSEAYDRQSSALQTTIDKFKAFSQSLREFRDGLLTGDLSNLSPEAKYQELKSRFEQTYALAKAGDPTAMGNLEAVSQQFLEASKGYYASSEGYTSDFEKVRIALESTASVADTQVSIAQQQLSMLDRAVQGILDLNRTETTVLDALQRYFAAGGTTSDVGAASQSVASGAVTSGIAGQMLSNVAAYGAQYGGDAYYFIPGVNDFAAKQQVVQMTMDALAGSEYSHSQDETWQLATGHSQSYWEEVQRQYDAGLHPTERSIQDIWLDGSHADGLNYVPFDGYRAELHRGERVLTADQARQSDVGNKEVVTLLGQVLAELRADKVQRGAVAAEQIDRLEQMVDKLDATKRKIAELAS